MSNEYLVGQKILGYELQELIGSDGFGKVYKGVKKVGKDEYYAAIKHISLPKNNEYNDLLNSMGRNYEAVDKYYEKILDDMVNEINTLFYLSKKDNKNIVTYYDHDIVKQENPLKYDIFIRMEYLKPLNIYSNEGNMTVEDAINLGIDIARALDNCHKQGIIHRDVKEGNIFINKDGDFKLGDFGISRMLSDTNKILSMNSTSIFMEQEATLEKYYDKAVDIYSLGLVLYKLLNYNIIPFLPKYHEIYTSKYTDIDMNTRLISEKPDKPQNSSDELGKVILKACEIQESRYNSCEEFINDLIKVKDKMDKEELSKFLFEGHDEESKRDEEDLSESELIDNTVVISEDIDTVEEVISDFIKKKENKRKKVFLMSMTIATSLCLVLGFGVLHLKNKENIEKASIEYLKENLPKSSSKLGNLPGNISGYAGSPDGQPHIVTIDNITFHNNGWKLGVFDNESSEFTKLTDIEDNPGSFNKYGDFIYYIDDNYKVQKYNKITNEISGVYGICANQIIIMDDYLYYNDKNESQHLFKMSLIDGSKEKILNVPIYRFSISSRHILYIRNGDSRAYLLNLETRESYYISDINYSTDRCITLYENCILYINKNDGSLYMVSLSENNIDTESKVIIQENVSQFALEGKYLYFIEGDYNRYKNSKLLAKDLLSNEIYYIDENVLSINVSENVMRYSTDDTNWFDVFSPEKYEKINE